VVAAALLPAADGLAWPRPAACAMPARFSPGKSRVYTCIVTRLQRRENLGQEGAAGPARVAHRHAPPLL